MPTTGASQNSEEVSPQINLIYNSMISYYNYKKITMMDYYGSITQSKENVYKEILSRYPTHNETYIGSILDHLYETDYISEEMSVSGWQIFTGPEVCKKINEQIQTDLNRSEKRLLVARCLNPRDDCCSDIIESISQKI